MTCNMAYYSQKANKSKNFNHEKKQRKFKKKK